MITFVTTTIRLMCGVCGMRVSPLVHDTATAGGSGSPYCLLFAVGRTVILEHPVCYNGEAMIDKTAERMVRKGDQVAEQRIDPRRALEEIWPLSLRLFSLSGQYDVQSGLQRSAETIYRK